MHSWNKGFTKQTHPSVRKISRTMKQRGIDNFFHWREKMKRLGLIKSVYSEYQKNGDLAELIGVVLGDGYIGKFPRSEVLRIVSSSNNHGFIKRYPRLMKNVLGKKPSVAKKNGVHCTTITIYEKWISKRLGIPAGARKEKTIRIPRWILCRRDFIIRYLRGLYEAEGCYCVHKPTATYKFQFTNRNQSMLKNVKKLLTHLDFHPYTTGYQVQIARKNEVEKIRRLLRFRQY